MASATLSAVPTGGALGHHDARGIHVAADRAGHRQHDLQPSSGLRVRWPELFQQHRQRFTQLEPVAGGV